MAIVNFLFFAASLFIVVKSAGYCIKYSSRVARIFRLSEFIVSFFIVSVISVFPEASISIISAIKGVPEFGMGALLGSNIADLTLVFGVIALFAANGVHVKSMILKEDFMYLLLLLFPILLGWDGNFSRIDGILLVLGGLFFFFTLALQSKMFRKRLKEIKTKLLLKNVSLLIFFLGTLLLGSSFTVKYAVQLANDFQLPAILVGLTIISIGTCLPELLFSLRAVANNHDQLALGDILGTVIMDATIVLGIVAIINPFEFRPLVIYVTGFAMFFAGLLTIIFISSQKMLTKREGLFLIFFYIAYIIIEFAVNSIYLANS